MEHFATTSLAALIPSLMVTVPVVGTFDFAPYIAALGVFLALLLAFKILQGVVVSRLQSLSKKTSTDIDDVIIDAIAGIRNWVLTLVALFMALKFILVPAWLDIAMTGLVYFVAVWQVVEIAVKFVDYAAVRFMEKDEDGDGVVDPGAATASDMIKLMARIVLWVLGGLFVLSNLGIEITSLIAGLGIGGIAIAFALQGILSDLFASFSIYFDRPFRVGDFIVIGDDMGTVERIGIKTTRIRTLQGEELVVSNNELTSTRINNYKRMNERRIVFQFGITYETSPELVKQVPEMVKNIFTATEGARIDRVHFTSYGDFALIYEVVYFVESSDYNVYMDIQQQINFAMMDRFAAAGVDFAYPTQTIYTKVVE